MYAKTILAMNVSSGQSRMPNRIIAAEIPDSFAIFFSFLVFILLIILFMIDLLFCGGGLCAGQHCLYKEGHHLIVTSLSAKIIIS
jgi:hypothetical protein